MFRKLPFGAVPGFAPISPDLNDSYTMTQGFYKRLLRDVPLSNENRLRRLKEFVRTWITTHLVPIVPGTLEEWLASTDYDENRKDQLRTANEYNYGARPSARKCRHIDSFGKTESYPEFKFARVINSRCDAFKAWFGPYAKAMEHEVYKDPHFVKHDTPSQRAEKIRSLQKAGLHFYATDFTAFESHFIPEVMDAMESQLYRYLMPGPDGVFAAKVIAGPNHMRTRSGLRAKVLGRRMSGDMITSLGNGFSNLMLALFLSEEQGFELHGLVEGDDGLFATGALLTTKAYAELGFTIKMEVVDDPMMASFCGIMLTEDSQFIRDPRRVFQKFAWSSNQIMAKPVVQLELLRAKALSLACETPHCPIVGVLARRALLFTEGSAARHVKDGFSATPTEFIDQGFKPTVRTRESFAAKFGISIPTQLLAEAAIVAGNFALVAVLVQPNTDNLWYSNNYLSNG